MEMTATKKSGESEVGKALSTMLEGAWLESRAWAAILQIHQTQT